MRTLRVVLVSTSVLLTSLSVAAQNCAFSTDQTGKIVETCGSVGIGTTSPTQQLHVFSTSDAITLALVENTNATGLSSCGAYQTGADVAHLSIVSHGSGRTLQRYGITLGGWDELLAWAGNGLITGTLNSTPLVFGTNNVERVRVTSSGNVGINTLTPTEKLTVNGNITATGSITGASVIGATYQDIAEWVPASTPMKPGTVVVLNPEHSNEVMPSETAYDTRVAGVVSANPGVILGKRTDSNAMIATTGRVRVRVDATKHPIQIGDLLVTSDAGGTAMVSEPIEINGRKFHQPGTVIGKALEPLGGGKGEILVLLSLQ